MATTTPPGHHPRVPASGPGRPPVWEDSRRETRGSLLRWVTPAAAAAALLGSILAFGSEPPAAPLIPAPHALKASTGSLQLGMPSTWHRVRRIPRLEGLPLTEPLALAPLRAGPEDGLALAGMVDATDAGLLPPDLHRRAVSLPKRESVRLGQLDAYRYRDVRLVGWSSLLTIYVVPTTRGVATVACSMPEPDETFTGECDAIATTLELLRGRPLPLGLNREYVARVNGVIGQLDARRRTERGRLRAARSRDGQARRAADLAAVYGDAGKSLARGPLPAGTAEIHPRLVSALRDAEAAYRALSLAAGAGDRSGYAQARTAVGARESALNTALDRIAASR